MAFDTPVTLIIFNRPDLTRITFNAIARVKPKRLFVVADGPRNDEEREKCDQARAVIESCDWDCQIEKIYSEVNLGPRNGPITGLNQVFSRVDKSINIEDDVEPDPSFFMFCEELLHRYEDDERIMHIGGPSCIFDKLHLDESYYFSRYLSVGYGWATWKRAWKHYNTDLAYWERILKSNILSSVIDDDYVLMHYTNVLNKTYNNEIVTWDFQWQLACWVNSGLSVIPTLNLTRNNGFREDASHTTHNAERERNLMLARSFRSIETIKYPEFIVRNVEADRLLADWLIGKRPEIKTDMLRRLISRVGVSLRYKQQLIAKVLNNGR